MTKIAIHQPNFIPWAGYFYKIHLADVFVFLDDVQFTKNSFINRNQIKTPAGAHWLTMAIKKMPLETNINEIEISGNRQMKKILKTIKMNYTRAAFFDEFFPKIESVLLSGEKLLAEINMKLVKLIISELDIKTPVYKSSELKDIEGKSTTRLISICKALDANHYISGYGGNNYQEIAAFTSNYISAETYAFVHPEYHQLWGDFISNLSVIDLIFNHGKKSGEILKNSSVQQKSLILTDEE